MGDLVYLNGNLVNFEDASVSIYDHGFLYGDGAFEGIRVYGGKVFKLREHIARLYYSARALMIELPIPEAQFVKEVQNVVQANEVVDGYIRVTISRGMALGLDPKNVKGDATVVISTGKLALYPQSMYDDGLEVVTVSTRIPPSQCIEPRIKSLGKYVMNIQAKIEANRIGAGEGLMLNTEGYVAEATGDNIFIMKNGVIITPPPYAGILQGITRDTVIELAREGGYEVVERLFTLFDVYSADEAFLTGTAAEVIPMVKLDGRIIGAGKPGPITKELIGMFRTLTRGEGVPV